jgi:hypothetical protein
VYEPMSSDQEPAARDPGEPAVLERFGFAHVRRCGELPLRFGRAIIQRYVDRKRRRRATGARLAEAMVRYAELCMSPRRTERDHDEAAKYLDEAADLYTEAGQSQDAARALALRSRAGGEGETANA